MISHTFFNLSLNLAIRSSRSEPQSDSGLIFADYIEFCIFGCKEYSQSDFGVDHLLMSMWGLLLCCWKRVFAVTRAFSGQNIVRLCPASFCAPRPNLPATPGVS